MPVSVDTTVILLYLKLQFSHLAYYIILRDIMKIVIQYYYVITYGPDCFIPVCGMFDLTAHNHLKSQIQFSCQYGADWSTFMADTNHDGGLDREEAKNMPMLSMYFDEVDANKDGKVTRQEYFDAMPLLHGAKKMDMSGKSQSMQ